MRTDSFTRRAPLVIFIYFAGAIVLGATVLHPAYLAAAVSTGAAYLLMVRGARGLKTLAAVAGLFFVIAALNPVFNTGGETELFSLFGRRYTLEALIRGCSAAGVFAAAVLWFACFNSVMTREKFISLFGDAAPSLSTVLVTAFRLVPETAVRAKRIGEAREGIGKGAEGSFSEKLRSGSATLGALTSFSLEGGVTTGDSMRARGYGTGKRTSYGKVRFTAKDASFLAAALALIVLFAVFAARGAAGTSFEPRFTASPLTGEGLVCFIFYSAYFMIPSVLHIKEETIWISSGYKT